MGVLSALQPEKVFRYFEEITRIPHGSGNVERISDYLAEFARARGLEYYQDELKNIIIIQPATQGYEDEEPVILQGHMDMVAVHKPELEIDMRTQGLKVAIDGDNLYAEGTSLGGDDGIAVAYALAILDSPELRHPRLEIVITVDEETGMDGARGIDLSMLRGHRLLNLDSEEEGYFLTSCAGGARVNCYLSGQMSAADGIMCELTLDGLRGGHSGEEIDKERGNSNVLMGRALRRICEKLPARLVRIEGGLADNAIPRETKALVLLPDWESQDTFHEIMEQLAAELKEELAVRDPDVNLGWSCTQTSDRLMAFSAEDTRRMAAFLWSVPNGVQAMSREMPGLVETSLNLGILDYSQDGIHTGFSVRSSVESEKSALIAKLYALTELAGGRADTQGDYPGWKYRADSPLRDKMVRVYERQNGRKPELVAIHAGVECGLLENKLSDPDCVSIGPNIANIHTTEETLSISSVRSVWDFLVELLAEKD